MGRVVGHGFHQRGIGHPSGDLHSFPVMHLRIVRGVISFDGDDNPLAPGKWVEGASGDSQPSLFDQNYAGPGVGGGHSRPAASATPAYDQNVRLDDLIVFFAHCHITAARYRIRASSI